jgi:hypothetical protein
VNRVRRFQVAMTCQGPDLQCAVWASSYGPELLKPMYCHEARRQRAFATAVGDDKICTSGNDSHFPVQCKNRESVGEVGGFEIDPVH